MSSKQKRKNAVASSYAKKNGGKNQKNHKGDKGNVRSVTYSAPESNQISIKSRLILIIVAAILAVALLVGAILIVVNIALSGGRAKYNMTASGFYDYSKVTAQTYLDLKAGNYKQIAVDMQAYYDENVASGDIVNATVDDNFVNEHIAYLLLGVAQMNGAVTSNPAAKIGYGDLVSLYVLGATAKDENGNIVSAAEEYFVNAYGAVASLTVGAWAYGEEFDEALIGLDPHDFGYMIDYDVAIADITDDMYVVVSYTATIDGKDAAYTTVSSKRLAGSDELVRLFRENGSALYTEETIKFSRTEDIDEDGTEEKVNYSGTILGTLKERSDTITTTLPDDYFVGDEYEDYAWLNGKQITLEVVITGFTDYAAARPDELDYELVSQILTYLQTLEQNGGSDYVSSTGFKLAALKDDATEEEEKQASENAVNDFKKYVKEQLEAAKAERVKFYQTAALWEILVEKNVLKAELADAYSMYYSGIVDTAKAQYPSYTFYGAPYPGYGYFTSIDDFAASAMMYGYGDQFDSLHAYADYTAKAEICYNVLVYSVFEEEKLVITDGDLAAAIDTWVASQAGSYVWNDATQSYKTLNDKADVRDYYGEDNIRMIVRNNLVIERVEEFFLANNIFNYEPAGE